jgi:hypothetical protein
MAAPGDTVEFTDEQFNVVDTAKKELCLLDVSDFNFSGFPKFALKTESRDSVKLFAESQAIGFWENSNDQYDRHYRTSYSIKNAPPDMKMQALESVISSQLCSAEHMTTSMKNSAKRMRDSRVMGADRSSCFVTREQYGGIVKKKTLKWDIRRTNIEAMAPQLVPACIAFYRDHYFAPEIAQLQAQLDKIRIDEALARREAGRAKRAAEQAAAEAAAAKEAERQRREAEKARQLQAKRAAEERRKQQETELRAALDVLAPENARVVLGPDSGKPRVKGDLLRNLNEANKAGWDAYDSNLNDLNGASNNPPPFQKPELQRGEFEKTADFEKRLAAATTKARAEHEQQVAQWRQEKIATEQESQRMRNNQSAALLNLLRPELQSRLGRVDITQVTYDADAETFDVAVASSVFSDFRIVSRVATPIDRAPAVKEELSKGSAWAVFMLENQKLKPRGVLLRGGKTGEVFHGAVKSFSASNFQFSAQTRIAFEAQLTKEDSARQAQAERDRVERERQQAAAQERRRKERANWPAGAIGTIDSGTFMCVSQKSAMKVLVSERANNPYVSFPGDCLIIPNKSYVAEHRETYNGLAVVRLVGSPQPGYTDTSRINR